MLILNFISFALNLYDFKEIDLSFNLEILEFSKINNESVL